MSNPRIFPETWDVQVTRTQAPPPPPPEEAAPLETPVLEKKPKGKR